MMRELDAVCENRHSVQRQALLQQLATFSLEDREAYLYDCAAFNTSNLVRCVLESGVAVDARAGQERSRTSLMRAADSGSADALKALLAGGADHTLVDSMQGTALHLSAYNGHLACLEALLAAGASPNAADAFANTPLMTALMAKHMDCALALLPVTNLMHTNCHGAMVLQMCGSLGCSEECFELLLSLTEDVDVRSVPGESPCHLSTALHCASQNGQYTLARALLKRGADRMARDSLGRTPLHLAAMQGQLACIVLLVGRQGKVMMTPDQVNATAVDGLGALHLAAFGGHQKCCGVLLAAGAQLDASSPVNGHTPLTAAQATHPNDAALIELLSGRGPAQLPGTVCDHCGKTAEQASVNTLKACGGCQAARFCGAACIAAAWPGHKKACKARRAVVEAAAAPKIAH